MEGIDDRIRLTYQVDRKPDGKGYVLRFDPALEDFPGEDAVADTRRLVALLEQQIRECPAQYFWKQRRFRRRRGERGSDDGAARKNPIIQ